MSFRRYIGILTVTAAVLYGAVIAVNWWVDPYGYYRDTRAPGFNALKPRAHDHGLRIKTHLVEKMAPRTIIVGNSRVDIAFDPASPAWQPPQKPVFNFGIPGISITSLLGALVELVEIQPPRYLLVGVDFVDFLERSNQPPKNRQPDSTSDGALSRFAAIATETTEMLASLAALNDSLYTVRAQSNPMTMDMTPAGFNNAGKYRNHIATEGHAVLAEHQLALLVRTMSGTDIPDRENSPTMTALHQLLVRTRDWDTEIILFTYPYHSDMLEVVDAVGLWPSYERWRRELTMLVSAEQNLDPERNLVLWDFSEITPITTEPFPPPKDTRTHMKWYWETSHFKASVGTLMVARMLGNKEIGSTPKIGTLLNSQTIGPQLASVRRAREKHRRSNPEAHNRIQGLFAKPASTEAGAPSQ